MNALLCRTCGHALTDVERENYVDQCTPCTADAAGVPMWCREHSEPFCPRHGDPS